MDVTVTIRPMAPDDADRLLAFHSRLSDDTTYLRYFSPHPHLSPREVVRFTVVDHLEREAFVAVEGDDIVGVGRYDRRPGTADAEVAFVVEDRWQDRGIGTRLMERLMERAREVGIERLVGETLAGNRRMLKLFRRVGGTTTFTGDGVAEAVVPLR